MEMTESWRQSPFPDKARVGSAVLNNQTIKFKKYQLPVLKVNDREKKVEFPWDLMTAIKPGQNIY